ncbi:MAG: type VI secretion system protein ImpL, partial [Reinekea sp.]
MKQFVGKLIPIVANFFTGLSAGVLAVVILVWFGGRFIGLTAVSSRLWLIALIVLSFLGWLLARRIYLAKKNNSLETGLKAKTDSSMQKKLDDVMMSLKRSDLGSRYRGNSALYALPWYMIIGPSAAGKSTFFSRSGLSFPLNDDKRYHLEGIGGTKDCDWWFSDQAILIDTAGRYSNDKDNGEWLEFLSTLKKNRPKAPVNGVILTFPLDELLINSNEEAEQHLKHIKNRLHEISQLLGLMVPIYLVITKCDLLKGFESFFEDLSDQEVSQPWGVYMLEDTENKAVDAVTVFKAGIQSLYFRLLEQRTQKMSMAQSSQTKSEIYQFPSQFNAASHKLIEFLTLLVKDSPYHERPWFGGVYFTSSMQEGDLLERKSNSIRDVFLKVKSKVLTSKNQPRSYFIRDFFTQVVFPLKDALRGNRKRQNFHRIAKAAVLSGFTVMVVIIALALSATYTANKGLLASYEKKAVMLIERLESNSSSELEKFDALVGLFNHYESLANI